MKQLYENTRHLFFYDECSNLIIKKSKDLKNKELVKEYNLLKSLDSKYVVKVYDFIKKNNAFTMESMDGSLRELLYNKIINLNFIDKINIINKVFDCLIYLENNKIVHLDITTRNFLYKKIENDFIIKLTDFEFSCKEFEPITFNDNNLIYLNFQIYDKSKALCIYMLYTGLTNILSSFLRDEINLSSFINKCENYEFKSIKESKKYFNKLICDY